ncbi:hypothetical protein QAD02_001164 [Eretmocerus hayati]|uniref:Uncharacterized protein n=1 Tax=Eretmocerus hayati TaxID=131215 RepID=A0ACC2NFH5_9HYME|nr:hypothetical protein QAD02_001164 [Eretmocerus hayati]
MQLGKKIAKTVELFNANETISDGKLAYMAEWSKDFDDFGSSEDERKDTKGWSRELLIYPDRIESAEIRIVKKKNCIEKFEEKNLDRYLCVDTFDRSVCARNSGGPLMINGRQAGIIPKGKDCHLRRLGYVVFIAISNLRKWIDGTMEKLVEKDEEESWTSVFERYHENRWRIKKIWHRAL